MNSQEHSKLYNKIKRRYRQNRKQRKRNEVAEMLFIRTIAGATLEDEKTSENIRHRITG